MKKVEKMTQFEIEEGILDLLSVYGIAHKIAILEKLQETLEDFRENNLLS